MKTKKWIATGLVLSAILCAFSASAITFNVADDSQRGGEQEGGTVTTSSLEGSDVVLFSANSVAISGSCGGNLTWTLNLSDNILTVSGTGDMFDYTSNPQPWKDYIGYIQKIVIEDGVTRIGADAFANCSYVEQVEIANSVNTIGTYAFENCTSLRGIKIPDTVTSLGCAFFGCTSLGTIAIPEGITRIGSDTFGDCTNLRSILIPTSVTDIGGYNFGWSPNLTDVYYLGTQSEWNAINIDTDYNTYLNSATVHYGIQKWGYCGGEGDGSNLLWTRNTDWDVHITGVGKMEDYTWEMDDNYGTIDAGCGPWGTAVEEVYIGEGATSIGQAAFYDVIDLSGDIVMPSTMISIGEGAFYEAIMGGVTNKATITLNEGLMSIGDFAFGSCCDLQGDLIIPNSVTYVGMDAFSECGFDGELVLGTGLEYIGDECFWGCTDITNTEIYIGDNVKHLGETVFPYVPVERINVDENNEYYLDINGVVYTKDMTTLQVCPMKYKSTSGFEVPNSVTKIADMAFFYCQEIKGELTIPYGVEYIGFWAFEKCTGFTGDLIIPDSITHISSSFLNCSGFNGKLKISRGLKEIPGDAFRGCYGITSDILIPEGIEKIGSYSFYDLRSYSGDITIASTVTEIGHDWDSRSPNIKSIHVRNSQENLDLSAVSGYSTPPDDVVYYLIASGDCGAHGDNVKWYLYEDGMLDIDGIGDMVDYTTGYNAPWNSYDVNSLIIREGVTRIGNYTFDSRGWLRGELQLPDGLISIGKNAFGSLDGLSGNLVIPNTVTTIEDYAFSGLDNINGELSLPDGLISIGKGAFAYSTFVGDLIIPDSVVNIGESAFMESTFDGILKISKSLNNIPESVFYLCEYLTGGIDIPSGVTTIGKNAFGGCVSFDGELRLPDTLVEIGETAFWEDECITGDLIIPDSVTTINDGAFETCRGFNGELKIGNSLEQIGNRAFSGLSGLNGTVTIPECTVNVGWHAFYDMPGITDIYILQEEWSWDPKNCICINSRIHYKYDLSACIVSLNSDTAFTYTGEEIKPTIENVTVTSKYGRSLYGGTDYADYAISDYSDNINVGTGKIAIIVPENGISYNKNNLEFNINPRNISETSIKTIADREYTGGTISPLPVLAYNNMTLSNVTDYALNYSDNINVGEVTITIYGKGNYTGATTTAFSITAKSLTGAVFTGVTDKTYTKEPITQDFSIGVDGVTLESTADYTTKYTNNENVGLATITVTGTGNYTGNATKTFNISKANISTSEVTGIVDKTFSGLDITQDELVVTWNSKELNNETDYTVSYKDNVDAGTAEITLTGKDNFEGSIVITFEINPKSLSSAVFSEISPLTFTGEDLKPDDFTVSVDGVILKKDFDYTIDYTNNIDASKDSAKTAIVIIKGINNYTDIAQTKFNILSKYAGDGSSITISIDKEHTYTGKEITPKPSIQDPDRINK